MYFPSSIQLLEYVYTQFHDDEKEFHNARLGQPTTKFGEGWRGMAMLSTSTNTIFCLKVHVEENVKILYILSRARCCAREACVCVWI